jgi:7-cyano-7-deazaguanine synthase in queuosine biosynthesis
VEYCDLTRRRPSDGWVRHFDLRIPVHDPTHWGNLAVSGSLQRVLSLLTGDRWNLVFTRRRNAESPPRQSALTLPTSVSGVIPFSDGMDSCVAAGVLERELRDGLVRIRLGSKKHRHEMRSGRPQPFAAVPYTVRHGEYPFSESSARSRGFKFATISAIAAYLAKATKVYVSESGQGSLGPSLVPVGQIHPDYRTHPQFMRCIESYFDALVGRAPKFEFPHLWQTKAQTLRKYVALQTGDNDAWRSTWSCWQQSRQASVNGRKRQCGICAACLLRRLAVHGAGLTEERQTYVWEDLSAPTIESGCASDYDKKRITSAMRQYAIAGALHLDHLAALRSSRANAVALNLEIARISSACGIPVAEARMQLDSLLAQHEAEWFAFRDSLGNRSFLLNWTMSPS